MIQDQLKRRIKRLFSAPDNGVRSPDLNYPQVELTYWSPAGGLNFGDYLSRVVVELMLARSGFTLRDEVSATRQMLAIGSVLHFARPGAVIWGTGVNRKIKDERNSVSDIDVRAVRGPLTAEFLRGRGIAVPQVYGDPALLLPFLCQGRFAARRELGSVFVPNLNDLATLHEHDTNGLAVISPDQSWNACIQQITGASFVVASSLHGLIIAEAFGIPARYVRLSEREHLFKYEDYYLGTGRTIGPIARSVSEAAEMGGAALPNFDPAPLMAAFPLDLWGGAAPATNSVAGDV
jgi:pyruvyltransferase